VGYPELLRVLGEEAAREAREIREAAERDAARIVSEARDAAAAARAAILLREQGEAGARRRAADEEAALALGRALLVAQRRHLDGLRAEHHRRVPDAGGPGLDEELLRGALEEVGPEPFEVVVDPGAEVAARQALLRIDPAAAARARVRAADVARGGVLLRVGRRELDATLPARLERAWPALEAELAAILFAGG
jgi:V/A-type H+-transporting ATPase subunit E